MTLTITEFKTRMTALVQLQTDLFNREASVEEKAAVLGEIVALQAIRP